MKIIINADDFGFSHSINEGIIHAFNQGLISTTTLMANQPYAEGAIELAKANNLPVGLHITLTAGKPFTNCTSLTDENGNFYKHKLIKNGEISPDYNEVIQEIKAQLEFLLSRYGKCEHLDCHHFSKMHPTIHQAIKDVAQEYNLPMRGETAPVFKDFFDDNAKAETIIDFINSNSHLETLEIMTHCGFNDEDTEKRTSYNIGRENEIHELEKLKQMGFYDNIELVTFQDL